MWIFKGIIMGGILFWIIACIIGVFIQRKAGKKEGKAEINIKSIIVLTIIFYILFFASSLLIPEHILDAGWYRALWVLLAPLVFAYIFINEYVFKNLAIEFIGIKLTNKNIGISLFWVTYTFPFTTISTVYILHSFGVW